MAHDLLIFGAMKSRYCLLILTMLTTSFQVLGTAAKAATTNTTVIPVLTNAPAIPATNEVKEPVVPEDKYTNSIEMQFAKVADGVWAGKFEVTQKEFQKVMASNPSEFRGDTLPVDSVTYNEAAEFCQKLTETELKNNDLPKGYYYTLPTEEEWQQLADEAGLDTAVTSLGGATRSSTSPVGSLKPNSLGLYDVRGNVSEFCLGDDSKPFRFLKGGSWQDFTEVNLRPEFRWYCKPDERQNTFGFRCLLKKGAAAK